MKTTSHFIGIPLKNNLFSDIFIAVYEYLKTNSIESCLTFQNPLSMHITLYYLEKDIDKDRQEEIKEYIQKYNCNAPIMLQGIDYFFRNNLPYVLYLSSSTSITLKKYTVDLHQYYERNEVIDNSYDFSPHITLFRIQQPETFVQHQKNIEAIIEQELQKLENIDISEHRVCLYAVNSRFKEEIQIQL